jgi:hypothetical protein
VAGLPEKAVQAALKSGLLNVRASKLARETDLSESCVRSWLAGARIGESSEAAIERVLGNTLFTIVRDHARRCA